ncbi:MAG: GNAT family N-acetyltransferase [Clostridia bacterium]|nr:GNAT family N-acetyltransferase [Clostridia bacterium]
MTIRHIKEHEYDEANYIKYIAFGRKADTLKNDADDPAAIWPDVVVACDDENKITARARNIHYTMMFDGRETPITGVSGVGSLPEARGKGRVRDIIRFVNREDRADGNLFSTLYPFSHQFYARFGYALVSELDTARFPISAVAPFLKQASYSVRRHLLEDGFEDMRAIQRAGLKNMNLAQILTDRQFKKSLGGDPLIHGDYRYILYNDDKAPIAWLYYTDHETSEHCTMKVHAAEWVDRKAFISLLSFIASFSARYDQVEMPLPTHWPFLSIVPEPKLVTLTRTPNGMARALDPAAVLRAMRHPAGAGAYRIAVEDDFLPENSGVYAVSFNNGAVSVEKTEGAADICCQIGAFTQLVLGYLTPADMIGRDDVAIHGNEETLNRVFVHKATGLPHHF